MAHENGLTSLTSTPVFEDHEKGMYIFRATAIGVRGDQIIKFEDEGDAMEIAEREDYYYGSFLSAERERVATEQEIKDFIIAKVELKELIIVTSFHSEYEIDISSSIGINAVKQI